MQRRRLRSPTRPIEGHGIHGGEPVRLRMLPAAAGSGLRFRRMDLDGRPELGAADLAGEAAEGGRTTLRRGSATVQTVEHLAAAAWGLGLDDLLVEIEGPEPPAADGSALPFAQLLLEAGVEDTDEPRPELRPPTALCASRGAAWAACTPSADGLTLRYLLDYPGEPLAQGCMELAVTPESFLRELAPARTFCPAAQVEKFRAMGWGKGATAANTIVFEGTSVHENQLRFPDEPLRHKLLDMVGDLAFCGAALVARVSAVRSGHALNRELFAKIATLCSSRNGGTAMYDVNEIRRLLPHRYPFLLVDRVLELEIGKRAVAIKNLTANEPFFQGHFPNLPVMPGVLQIEAMAQVGGILLHKSMEGQFQGKVAVLASIDDTKLRRAVLPGDQLVMEVKLDRLRGSFGQCSATASVDGKLVAETVIRFAIVSTQDLAGTKSA
jgi:UDP-3-O-[3-hydroxymyristoyl] N-acetylglucosamine deacetylase/3-hydroxyacyl-[acyl-carrier-protein] dehydratase